MRKFFCTLFTAALILAVQHPAAGQTLSMADYKAIPTFVNQTVPPLVLLTMSKDHRLFYKAYNDVMDLDGDGTLETTYKDSIDYYGYFDSKKCYSYIAGNSRFEPQVTAGGTNGHTCSSQWSGNFLNWSTMARIDVVRKVIYGGYRKVDTATATVLSRTLLPRDAHSWVKVYTPSGGSPAINTLTPYNYASISLCNLNTSAAETSSLVYVINGAFQYASSTEGKECVSQFQGGSALTIVATLNADVLVCMSSQPEANCEQYGSNWKPNGLMQKLGINRQGTTTTADDVIYMKFALISGSYGAHVGGGVLRSNVVDVSNEIDPATGIVAATSKIIKNLNAFKIVQYNYGTGWYDLNASPDYCVPSEPYTLSNNGTCKSWGNPMGEMLYEAIRYISGKTTPTNIFQPATPDPGIAGLTVDSWVDPWTNCPECSKAFVLMFSDAFPSYDSDHLPGSYWYAPVSPNDLTLLPNPPGGPLNVQTLIDNSGINTLENITSSNVYIGQSGATNDRSCTPKAADLKIIRGLCVEEPTKQGAYYMAGLAHYAKTNDLRPDIPASPKAPTTQNLTVYSVVTSSPYPKLEFSVGPNTVQLVPIFHDGCPAANYGSPGYGGCTAQGTGGDNSKGEIVDFRLCENDADWTTEQGNGYTSCYDIMWDDAEQGWDYELDVRYRLYVQTNAGAGTITVRSKGLYAAAGHTDYAGFFINGVSAGGEFYEIACGGGAGFNDCDVSNGITGATEAGNTTRTRTFTVTSGTAGFLKDPFWYAAKYGGFEDSNANKQPDLQVEWDKDNNGDPDTYFFAASPLKLEAKLTAAFISILNKSSSGTAASVLASSTTGEGALYQSYFFPLKFDPDGRDLHWMGYTQGLFVDTFGNLREDTNADGRLVYTDDKIVVTQYNTATGQVDVLRYDDANGDGKKDATPPSTTTLEQIKPVWEAGKRLALTDASSRHIKTWIDLNGDGVVNDTGSTSTDEYIEFDTNSLAKLTSYLKAGDSSLTPTQVINFIRGCEISVCPEQATLRDRRTDLNGGIGTPNLKVWKFGDPVYSTPVIIGAPKERFDVLYGDSDYADFYALYRNRRQVAYAGANDGMLHAFNIGTYNAGDDTSATAPVNKVEHGWFTTSTTTYNRGQNLGDELWAYVPQELLPQLQWLARQDYSHVYYVDLKPRVTDARIFTPDADHPGGWGTILIGGFRMGGSCYRCATQAKQVQFTADFGNGTQTRKFLSGYFVLDITNPEKEPTLLWSFSHDDLGLTTSVPTVVRVRPGGGSKTQSSDEKWFAIFGSGPTNYDGGVAAGQRGKLFVVDLVARKTSSASSTYTIIDAGPDQAFMSDIMALEKDLDFRDDAIYVGQTISSGGSPAWTGKLLRLTTNCLGGISCNTDPTTWGMTGNKPTDVLQTFSDPDAVPATSRTLGPITLKPSAAIDDRNRVWLFVGSGRYYSTADKADTSSQYLAGVRDPILNGSGGTESPWCTGQSSTTSCVATTLADVSNAVVCWLDGSSCIGSGASANQVTNVPGLTGGNFSSLLTLTGNTKHGWFSKLPMSGERAVGAPIVIGGLVFYSTFVPSTDPCIASGNGYLYGLYYVTGTAPSEPIFSGTSPGGTIAKSVGLGQGVTSTPSFHIGQGGVQADIQQSHGGITSISTSMSGMWSRYVSWIHQRD